MLRYSFSRYGEVSLVSMSSWAWFGATAMGRRGKKSSDPIVDAFFDLLHAANHAFWSLGQVAPKKRKKSPSFFDVITPLFRNNTCFQCDGRGLLTKDCPACHGRGWHGGTCNACHGKGRHDYPELTCRNCRGTGQHVGRDCLRCVGTGIYREARSEPCRKCDGRGEFHDTCRACSGTRSLTKTCGRCNGSGRHRR